MLAQIQLLTLYPFFIFCLFTTIPPLSTAKPSTTWTIDPIFNRTGWHKIITPYNGTNAVRCPNIANATAMLSSIKNSTGTQSGQSKLAAWTPTGSAWSTVSKAVADISSVLWLEHTDKISTSTTSGCVYTTDSVGPSAASIPVSGGSWKSKVTVTITVTRFPSLDATSAMSVSSETPRLTGSTTTSSEHGSSTVPSEINLDSTVTLKTKVTVISTSTLASNTASLSLSTSPRTVLSSLNSSPSTVMSTSQTPTTSTQSSPSRYRGFNIINQSPSNPATFKTPSDWATSFRHIHSLSDTFNAIRLYSTTDGPSTKHLLNAIPAARSHNLSMHIGVWSGGDAHTSRFVTEKAALDEALTQLGCAGIVAVSVGNEDMYSAHRPDAGRTPLVDIMLLVNQTREVRDVLARRGCNDVKLTHTDTYGDWLTTNISAPLIHEVDFLTVNIFPYWSGEHIDSASRAFFQQLQQTRDMATKYGKDVWIGETGWPVSGDKMGDAVPSVESARRYWKEVGCQLMAMDVSVFWYVEFDAGMTPPSFGVMDPSGESVIGHIDCE